jgi:hypothetical protein
VVGGPPQKARERLLGGPEPFAIEQEAAPVKVQFDQLRREFGGSLQVRLGGLEVTVYAVELGASRPQISVERSRGKVAGHLRDCFIERAVPKRNCSRPEPEKGYRRCRGPNFPFDHKSRIGN